MNNPVTPEQWLTELSKDNAEGIHQNRLLWQDADRDMATATRTVLEMRAAEIEELNRLCDKLDEDLGVAHAANEILRTEQKEWQLTVSQLQDSMGELRRRTIYIDRVRDVLKMAEFTVNVVKRAYEMPLDCSAMLDNMVVQLRSELLYPFDDEIPF